ncbi:MAG: hypothetical protein AAGJ10_12435 [Bacteroidota bacterium]
MLSSFTHQLGQRFDQLFTEARIERLEHLIIGFAIGGFLAHMALITWARVFDPPFLASLNTNYLSALYTPFSFVLFYEVLLLILAIPNSTSASLGRQYEIISLIVLRNVFKDIANLEDLEGIGDVESLAQLFEEYSALIDVLVDMGGGLLMFLLVAVFYHIRHRQATLVAAFQRTINRDRQAEYISRKKVVALGLTGLLFVLATYNLGQWSLDAYRIAFEGATATVDIKTIFYLDLFTVMIFSDVLILLFSMMRIEDYKLVFRNAGFIVSTILLRLSLSIKKPFDVELALVAMAFGVLVLLVYGYFRRIDAAQQQNSLLLT